MNNKLKNMLKKEVRAMYRYKRIIIASLTILLLLTFYLFKDSTTPLKIITFVGLLIAFYLGDHLFDIRFSIKHYTFIIIIGIGGILLSHLYFVHPNYDKVQHLIFPMLLSSMVFHMANKLKLEFKWKLFFTFATVGMILGSFEIGEYLLDRLFDLKLQGVYLRDLHGFEKFNILQSPIDDTITDLSFGIFGSGIYAIYNFLSHKLRTNKEKVQHL